MFYKKIKKIVVFFIGKKEKSRQLNYLQTDFLIRMRLEREEKEGQNEDERKKETNRTTEYQEKKGE